MMRRLVLKFLLILLLPLTAGSADAQISADPEHSGLRSIRATRIAGIAPVLDGSLEDTAWAEAGVARDFVQRRPTPGAPASRRTEVRVLFDDDALYVGARLYDSPDSVVAQLGRRDAGGLFSDWILIALDSYHDRRTAFVFGVNPRGVKQDLFLSRDGNPDRSWDAVWEAEARIDSLGWTAEFRFPLSQLRYSPGQTVWGVQFQREIARHGETALWSPTPPDAAGIVSRFGDLAGLADLPAPHRVEVQPYTVARITRAPGDAEDPFYRRNDLQGSLGLDLRYGLGSSFTLTATLNPDFGQVEADPSEVNLTAFETYFSERRPFFTEGANLFDTGWPRLFYSRRVGRAPQGSAPGRPSYIDAPEVINILGAAKLTGKTADGWSVGVMDAVTAREKATYIDTLGAERSAVVEPLTNYAVARVVRSFNDGRSAVGGIATTTNRWMDDERISFLPLAAYAGGIDGRHRFGGGSYEVEGSARGSHVRGTTRAISRLQLAPGHYFQRPDAEHLHYDPERTALSGWSADLELSKIAGSWRWNVEASAYSPGFEINDLGYYFGADELRQRSTVRYQRSHPGTLFRSWSLDMGQMSEWTFGRERKDAALDLDLDFQLHNQWGASIWYMRHIGGVSPSALRGGPSIVYPGRHMGAFSLHSDRRKSLSARLYTFWEVEDGTGGHEFRPSLSLSWRASSRMELSLQPSIAWKRNSWQWVGRREVAAEPVYLLGRLDQTTARLRARLDYTFSPELSLQVYAQPYISAGNFSRFKTVVAPQAERFEDRFHTFGADEIREGRSNGRRTYQVDLTGDREPDFTLRDPDFNYKAFRSNAVLRWEYRPGSTLFVVWSQGRNRRLRRSSFDIWRDTGDLFGAPGTNTLLVKVNYWLGM